MDSRLELAIVFGLGPKSLSAIPVVTPSNRPRSKATTTIAITSGLLSFRRLTIDPAAVQRGRAAEGPKGAQIRSRRPPAPGADRGRDRHWPQCRGSAAPAHRR